MFCMGNPHNKEPEDIVKFYFDRYITETETQLTDEDRAGLLADMAAMDRELSTESEADKVEDSKAKGESYDLDALRAFRDKYIDVDRENCTGQLADFIEGLLGK